VLVFSNEVSARESVTEDAVQFAAPKHASSLTV
jgi:hypothetical protein